MRIRDWSSDGCSSDRYRLALYDRQAAVWDAQLSDKLAAALAAPAPCVFLLTSAEGVDAVHANMLRLGLQDAWARARFVVIHERVASRLQSLLQASGKVRRSEEHTSELQSLMRISYAVFCLKKKNKMTRKQDNETTSQQSTTN